MTVEDEQRHHAFFLAEDPGDIEIFDVVSRVAVVSRAIDRDIQRNTTTIKRGELIGIIDCLTPGRPVLFCPDRGDDVDELGDAGDAHAVRAADELIEQTGNEESILEIIGLFQQGGRFRPIPALDAFAVVFADVIPDVPFVEADGNIVLARFLAFT